MKGGLLMAAALLLVGCEPPPRPAPATSIFEARRNVICDRIEVEVIADDDPALPLFHDPGESLADAKVDLAVERANICDDPECDSRDEGDDRTPDELGCVELRGRWVYAKG